MNKIQTLSMLNYHPYKGVQPCPGQSEMLPPSAASQQPKYGGLGCISTCISKTYLRSRGLCQHKEHQMVVFILKSFPSKLSQLEYDASSVTAIKV